MHEMRRRSFLGKTGAVAFGTPLLAGCLDGGPVKNTNQVDLTENGFEPKNVHIDSQKSLTWINQDTKVHTVTSATSDLKYNTKLKPDQAVGKQFIYDGVYKFVCTKHGSKEDFTGERMKLSVGSAKIETPVE